MEGLLSTGPTPSSFLKNNLTPRQLMRCFRRGHLRSCNVFFQRVAKDFMNIDLLCGQVFSFGAVLQEYAQNNAKRAASLGYKKNIQT